MSSIQTQADPIVARLQVISDLIGSGLHAEAAKELNATHKAFPTDPRPLLLGARSAEAVGNTKGAIELFQRAIKLTPQWSVAVTELALLFERNVQIDEAMAQARKAVKLDPNNLDVLYRVIDMAHRVNENKQALEWLARAVTLAPENQNLRYSVARDHHVLGHNDLALAAYGAILEGTPNDASALLGRIQVAIASNNLELARQDSEALIALDPEYPLFAYWNEVAQGNTPKTMPAEAVLAVFDNGRTKFHEKVVATGMGYTLPQLAAEWIRERYPKLELNVLDLGCGTGLVAAKLGRIKGAMVGVDLSIQMIEQAARHEVYDKIHTVNVLDALTATPDSLYDVLTACEVFPYVGDLSQAVPDAFRLLVPGGHFIFSCEVASETGPNLVLKHGLRYQHKLSHIQGLCKAAGLDQIEPTMLTLFTENGIAVEGFAIIAHKPA